MKKLTVFLLLLLITASNALFAQKQTFVAGKVQSSFEAKYGKGLKVSWDKIADIYVGRFTNNNQNLEVYYSEEGELLAYARYIPAPYLPQLVAHAISTKFPGKNVNEIIEYTSAATGTEYFMHIVNNNVELFAKSDRDGCTEVLKKIKK